MFSIYQDCFSSFCPTGFCFFTRKYYICCKEHKKDYQMTQKAKTIDEIFSFLPKERIDSFNRLHIEIVKNLPKGFEPGISYGRLCYIIPHSVYPLGYHCNSIEPLPFASIASQKNTINFYHMGIYSNPQLLEWLVSEYPKHCKQKLDISKSCIRFKNLDDIPYELIGELMRKISAQEWISIYETAFKK